MRIFISDIILATVYAMRNEFTKRELLSESRARRLVVWRYAAMRVSRRLTGHSMHVIGLAFNRDHTTVLHGLRSSYDTRAHEIEIIRELRGIRSARHKRRTEAMMQMAEAAS
jgi:chromosomal replication initiation ATPase DnaA